MTKAEQNEIIVRHIDAELRDTPGINERVGRAFTKWFQALVTQSTVQPQVEDVNPEDTENIEEEAA